MASPPRLIQTQQVHFLRKSIVFGNHGQTLDVGCIPIGSLVIKPMSGVAVSTSFNGTAPQTVGIGTSASTSLWGTALALSATTFVATGQSVDYVVYGDTNIQCVVNCSAATTGAAEVIVCYIPDIDG